MNSMRKEPIRLNVNAMMADIVGYRYGISAAQVNPRPEGGDF